MTLDDLLDLAQEWRKHPPLPIMVQLLVEGLCGVQLSDDTDAPAKLTTAEELAAELGVPLRVEQPRRS